MSKFKVNSERENYNHKKHATKRYDMDDMTNFAYLSRGNAKRDLRNMLNSYDF